MMAGEWLPVAVVGAVALVLSIAGIIIQYLMHKTGQVKIFPKVGGHGAQHRGSAIVTAFFRQIIDLGNVITFGALYGLARNNTDKTMVRLCSRTQAWSFA